MGDLHPSVPVYITFKQAPGLRRPHRALPPYTQPPPLPFKGTGRLGLTPVPRRVPITAADGLHVRG